MIIDKTYLIILKQKTKMRKILTYAVSALALASCSSDSLVSDSPANTQAPIAFNVGQKNITRTTNLEDAKHYNFGVWAYKTEGGTSQLVMDNYLVGYSDGDGKGYDKSGITTWTNEGTNYDTDHTSLWFYQNLGTMQYLNEDASKGYTKDKSAFMSANEYQYLRYWDLAYTNTNFYAYAPYKSSGVSFKDGKIAVDKAANVAGYDNPEEHDFIYAGAQATNADKKDVTLTFKHLGAIVKVAFRENVNGYKVQLINVKESSSDPNEKLGVQATSAKVSGTTYIHTDATTQKDVTYLKSCGATINFADNINTPEVKVVTTDVTPSSDNLMFDIPTEKKHGLVDYQKDENSPKYVVLPEKDGDYAKSPTTYYAVVQPSDSETGFTLHISYNLIAEDNGEVVTVRDARVHVPYTQVRWQSNTSYTYNFTISQVSSGTTDPTVTPDLADPTVPVGTVAPIVFDGATISDYDPVAKNI